MADTKLYISLVELNSILYHIKDADARLAIEQLLGLAVGGMHFLGVTTDNIADGSTTNPITIDGNPVTAKAGDIVVRGELEFVWTESGESGKWQEFGSTGTLGKLAYKDSVTGKITIPSTTHTHLVNVPTYTVNQGTVEAVGNFTPNGSVNLVNEGGKKISSGEHVVTNNDFTSVALNKVVTESIPVMVNAGAEGNMTELTIPNVTSAGIAPSVTETTVLESFNQGVLPTASVKNEVLSFNWGQLASANSTKINNVTNVGQPAVLGTPISINNVTVLPTIPTFEDKNVAVVGDNVTVSLYKTPESEVELSSVMKAGFTGTEGAVSVQGNTNNVSLVATGNNVITSAPDNVVDTEVTFE